MILNTTKFGPNKMSVLSHTVVTTAREHETKYFKQNRIESISLLTYTSVLLFSYVSSPL
jgi:hypothetical protein